MDTASHVLFGVTLAGLAHLDPALAGTGAAAVMTGTVIGSNAPDFDGVFRLKGVNSYIRNHRGVTHSLPGLLVWPAFIAAVVVSAFGVYEIWKTVLLWTFIGVSLHVFLDMLNTYGVQCFRPLTKRWIHLDVLCIFEPGLFALHALGLLFWLGFGPNPGPLFAWIYGITAVYTAIRAIQHRMKVRLVRRKLGLSGICHVIPTLHPFHWRFVVETEDRFVTGTLRGNRLFDGDTYPKTEENAVVRATMGVDGVRAFLSFAQRVHVTCTEKADGEGFLVRWSDVRFWHESNLAFGVDVQLDRHMRVTGQTIGWRKKKWDPPYI